MSVVDGAQDSFARAAFCHPDEASDASGRTWLLASGQLRATRSRIRSLSRALRALLISSRRPLALVERDHFIFDARRELKPISLKRCPRQFADLPVDFDMQVAHRNAIAAAHRRFDSIDQPRALLALVGRQQLRSREHVAMERA